MNRNIIGVILFVSFIFAADKKVKDTFVKGQKSIKEISFLENYLVYIDKIENVNINKNDGQYMEYLNLSRSKIISQIYNTYDNYIKKRYEIDINYQTLNVIKNYFN